MRLDRESVLRLVAEHGGPEGLDLSGRDLTGIDLSHVDLHGAILSKADLREVDLRWADLRDTDLSWAVLRGGDLRWANFRGANLVQADLREVNMWGAELAESNLGGTDLAAATDSRIELTEGEPETVGTPSRFGAGLLDRLSLRLSARSLLFGFLVAILLVYFWGWAYQASYYSAFNLPPSAVMDLGSSDYLLRGGQVLVSALKFLLAFPFMLLYLLFFLALLLIIPLAFLALGTRIFAFIPSRSARNLVFLAFIIVYLFVFVVLMQTVIGPLWGAVFGSGLPFRDSFDLFFGLWQASSAVVKFLMLVFVALALIPVWALYRLLARWVQRTEVSPPLAARFPNLARAWNGLQGTRLFARSGPLSLRERNWAVVTLLALLLAIPTFFAQAGAVKASGDMCDGGDLPQITLFANNMMESADLANYDQIEACLRLLALHNNRYFVFYPFQTRMEGGVRRAKVLQFPADTVFHIIHSEERVCLTCFDTGTLPPAQAAAIVRATPTLVPTNTPLPSLTPLPTNTPLPTETNTPPPSRTPLPTNTQPPTATQPPPTATWTPVPFDQFEPDDLFEQAQFINVGETQRHNFNPDGDLDKLKFNAKAGRFYRVTTDKLALGVDTAVILAAQPGTLRFCDPPTCGGSGSADDLAPGNLASSITVSPARDDIIYVTLVNKGAYGPDKYYEVKLEEFQPTPTATRTITPVPTLAPTLTPIPTDTSTITPIPPSATPIPTNTNTPTNTWTPSPTPSALPLPTTPIPPARTAVLPSPTFPPITPSPVVAPPPLPTDTPSPPPPPSATPQPTVANTVAPTQTTSAAASNTPKPSGTGAARRPGREP